MDLSKIRQRLKETKVYSYSLDEFMGILHEYINNTSNVNSNDKNV